MLITMENWHVLREEEKTHDVGFLILIHIKRIDKKDEKEHIF
jgi:hypothetical protein